jgi:hypothetical protein
LTNVPKSELYLVYLSTNPEGGKMGFLRCACCHQDLPPSAFGKGGPKYRLGKHHLCQLCRRARAKTPRHAGREEILETRKRLTSE